MIGLKYKADQHRRGVTLVELLVVVTLLSILLGIAATAARTGTRGKKQREAARQINAFIAGARTRAVELDRSVGIEIVNNRPNEPQAGTTLYMVETPPPYAGDLTSAFVELRSIGSYTAQLAFNVSNSTNLPYHSPDATLMTDPNFIRAGDAVFLGYNNQPYLVSSVPAALSSGYRLVNITWQIDQPSPFPWITSAPTGPNYPGLPFQVYRQPQRNSVTPLQIPTGACIDLAFSGMGTTGQQLASFDLEASVPSEEYAKIMFSPNGTIDAVYAQDLGASSATGVVTYRGLPTGNINLLIGRYEKVVAVREAGVSVASAGSSTGGIYSIFNSPPEDGSNIADPEAFWVSINRITGNVATSNNAMVNDPASFTSDDALLASARRFAKQTQSISGR